MSKYIGTGIHTIGTRCLAILAVPFFLALVAQGRVLDNFDDNTKTAWKDFTFVPGLGIPVEASGQFRFEQPPAGRALFSASQKTSETFELKDGRTIEFRVDLVQGGDKDSFAVLAFIPTANSASTLAGYGIAKSTTDILVTKGINKYFYNENVDSEAAAKNQNMTLVLSLTAKGGNVIIRTQVLDKDNNDEVVFERTFVDTPGEDTMSDGKDDPAAPFITDGYFSLYLYQDYSASAPEDPYRAVFDNAEVFVTDSVVLDDFNDNTKAGWTDFTFQPGFGIPVEANGQFRFEQPPAGRPIFSASQKTTRVFDLVEGERIEFRVDLVEGGDKDSFAVLAFIPTAGSPATLGGYGLAKSTTDILVIKGIEKYFYDQPIGDGPATKNQNITLVLSLTGRNGNVIIRAQILDKDNNNEVLFDRTFVDTPGQDPMAGGTDDPAAPFLTSGYFTLYLYQDFTASSPEDPYRAVFDNAVAAAPPVAANVPPAISDVQPTEFANFLPASTLLTFTVSDDKPIAEDNIAVTLNGTRYTKANGLTLTGGGNSRSASLGGLTSNVNYTAVISASDTEGETTTKTIYFDTFLANNFTIEVEDYNFNSGEYINNPVPIPEGGGPQSDAYANQLGTQDVDFNDSRTAPNGTDTPWRGYDPVRMQRSVDSQRPKYANAGGANAGVYDYDVGDITAGEWLNYTRSFQAGTYEVYLRQAVANMETGESVLEQVTSDRSQPNQTTRVLGAFLGYRSGFSYRNFALTDGSGLNKVIVRLSGVNTLRLRQVTADPDDGGRFQNYLIFIPVPDPGLQRAGISSLLPSPGSTVQTVAPNIEVVIQNRDTAVNTATIQLVVNGQTTAPSITPNASGAVVKYTLTPLPPSGQLNTAQISFKDDTGFEQSTDWSFTVQYKSLAPSDAVAGTVSNRGFRLRMVQAPSDTSLENSLERAENQLKPNSTIPKFVDTNTVIAVVNLNQIADNPRGNFENDLAVPGLDEFSNGLDGFAVEMIAYLDLPAGTHRFGVVTDDGYKIVAGANYDNPIAPPLAFHSGGTANETFDFVVQQAGIYPFRMVWYEQGGDAHAEWFSVNPSNGNLTLINDSASAAAIKAYTQLTAPAVVLQSATDIIGPFTNDASAVVDAPNKTITATTTGATRFFRLLASSTLKIKSITVQTSKVTLTYE